MGEDTLRVALLARPGDACDRLREALEEIGATPVLVADPTAQAPEAVAEAGASVIVVALDAATENVIDRFDAVFDAPGVHVLYEEAELAAARSGWEAARWRRHLSAKLFGHGDVLPPMPEGLPSEAPSASAPDTVQGAADAPATGAGEEAAFAFIAGDLDGGTDEAPTATADRIAFDPVAAEYELDMAFEPTPTAEVAIDRAALAGFDPDTDADALDSDPTGTITFEGLVLEDDGTGASAGTETLAFDGLNLDDDAGLPEVDTAAGDFSIELDTRTVATDNSGVVDLTFDLPGGDVEVEEQTSVPGITPITAGMPESSLSLASDEELAQAAEARHEGFRVDLADLERRVAGLSLVDEHVPAEDNGAVLVLAGIGGPDAVRQLLGALPQDFPRPVLVRQRLDGGRYDKLVAQMQRVSAMPVQLAEPGMPAEAGAVYVLPPEVGVRVDGGRRQFVEGGDDVFAALPAADSALLLLSGADPAVVDGALGRKAAGALVAGQSPEGCFDPAAIDALIARGGETGTPAELALRLIARWQQRATFGEAT